jgi:hypothetical protein
MQVVASFETIQPKLKKSSRRPRLARISRRGAPRRSRASTAMKIALPSVLRLRALQKARRARPDPDL